MRNFLDRIRALVTGHDTETAQLWLRMYWGFAIAPVTSMLNLILTGWGPAQWLSAVLSIILVGAMDNLPTVLIVAWFVTTLLCNNGIIWILALIAMIAMLWQRPTDVPTPRRAEDSDDGCRRVYGLIPVLRIPTPWLWYTWDKTNKVLTQDGWFVGRADPLYLTEVQDCRYSNALVRAITGTAILETMSKKIHVDNYLPWHRLPAWLAVEVDLEVKALKKPKPES